MTQGNFVRVRSTSRGTTVPLPAVLLLEELRRARAELKRLQDDMRRTGESDRLKIKIRLSEQRIAAIRARLKDIPNPETD